MTERSPGLAGAVITMVCGDTAAWGSGRPCHGQTLPISKWGPQARHLTFSAPESSSEIWELCHLLLHRGFVRIRNKIWTDWVLMEDIITAVLSYVVKHVVWGGAI